MSIHPSCTCDWFWRLQFGLILCADTHGYELLWKHEEGAQPEVIERFKEEPTAVIAPGVDDPVETTQTTRTAREGMNGTAVEMAAQKSNSESKRSVMGGLPAMVEKRNSRGETRKNTAGQIPAASLERRSAKKDGDNKSNSVGGEAAMVPRWAQKTIVLTPQKRGCHLITPMVLRDIGADLAKFKCGLAHFFLQHTSASLTINENYDSDVLEDVETFLNGTVPEGRRAPWKHTIEGPDDMPAHIKSSMFGCSITVPITEGHLNLGTWQGIWLCEHRDHGSARKVVVTMTGT